MATRFAPSTVHGRWSVSSQAGNRCPVFVTTRASSDSALTEPRQIGRYSLSCIERHSDRESLRNLFITPTSHNFVSQVRSRPGIAAT